MRFVGGQGTRKVCKEVYPPGTAASSEPPPEPLTRAQQTHPAPQDCPGNPVRDEPTAHLGPWAAQLAWLRDGGCCQLGSCSPTPPPPPQGFPGGRFGPGAQGKEETQGRRHPKADEDLISASRSCALCQASWSRRPWQEGVCGCAVGWRPGRQTWWSPRGPGAQVLSSCDQSPPTFLGAHLEAVGP